MRFVPTIGIPLLLGLLGGLGFAADKEVSVGMKYRLEQVVLPGPELITKPIEGFETPVVVRVIAAYPHGTDFRYDFEYYALEAGQFNLGDFLQRKDGGELEAIPSIPITVTSVLPEGTLTAIELESSKPPRMGGYRTLVKWGVVLWVLGLVAILFYRKFDRKDSKKVESEPGFEAKLRPKVEAAMSGKLDESGRAELERMLLTYWKRRLDLKERDAGEAMKILLKHREAGPLLAALEDWLHRPDPPKQVPLDTLLEPYRNLPETS